MKYLFIISLFLSLGGLMAQNSQIQVLQKELEKCQGTEYLQKSIQLCDAHFDAKHFERASQIAASTYEEAKRQGNLTYMAFARNREGRAIVRNPRMKPLEKLTSIEKFQESNELLEESGIHNPSLRKENLDELIRAGRHLAPAKIWQQTGKVLESALDTAIRDLAVTGKGGFSFVYPPETPPAPSDVVITSDQYKNEQRFKLFQKAMDVKILQMEQDLKEKHLLSAQGADDPSKLVQVAIADAKKQWPLEQQKFEKELEGERLKIENMRAEEIKEELLLAHYKNRYDSLMYQHMLDSIDLAKKEALLKRQEAEMDRHNARRTMWMVGSGSTFLLSFILFLGFRQQRKNNHQLSNKNEEIEKERKRSDELLLNILPAKVAMELKQYGAAKAHRYDSVTVLFSDFENFSRIAEILPPEKLVAELDYCFKAFDGIISKYKLEKIKTIGDAYMCAGGLPSPDNGHATKTVQAALEMQNFLLTWKAQKMAKNEPYFEARMGIHTGPIVAGVVGVKKFAYDIWGDTVNIAARMESCGETGKVNISGSTFNLVKDDFGCAYRGKIEAKNKGVVDMYFVGG